MRVACQFAQVRRAAAAVVLTSPACAVRPPASPVLVFLPLSHSLQIAVFEVPSVIDGQGHGGPLVRVVGVADPVGRAVELQPPLSERQMPMLLQ